jgi:hypothetical protein
MNSGVFFSWILKLEITGLGGGKKAVNLIIRSKSGIVLVNHIVGVF